MVRRTHQRFLSQNIWVRHPSTWPQESRWRCMYVYQRRPGVQPTSRSIQRGSWILMGGYSPSQHFECKIRGDFDIKLLELLSRKPLSRATLAREQWFPTFFIPSTIYWVLQVCVTHNKYKYDSISMIKCIYVGYWKNGILNACCLISVDIISMFTWPKYLGQYIWVNILTF